MPLTKIRTSFSRTIPTKARAWTIVPSSATADRRPFDWVLWIALALATGLAGNPGNHAFAEDSQWGHLKGRFIYDGELPEARFHIVDRDKGAFSKRVPDESLVVHTGNKGVANVLIFLLPVRGQELRVHDSFGETASAKIHLSMNQGRFEPHVILMRTTQTMVQANMDAVAHNANIQFLLNSPM